MSNLDIFSTRLKSVRNELGLSQKEFAEKVGCTAATLSAYENGTKNPSLEIVKNIAEHCDISIDWLCGLSDSKSATRKILTISDAIKIFFELEKINEAFACPEVVTEADGSIRSVSMYFCNEEMRTFIVEWDKIRDLHDSRQIDDELYDLWQEKTLIKYNIDIDTLPFN